jgi:hypothetical protein
MSRKDHKVIMSEFIDLVALKGVIQEAKKVAKQYRQLTGKPLGITGEVGEFIAANLLGLELTEARQPGYDAVAHDGHRIQIKARCVLPDSSVSQRVGSIKLGHEWDTVILVLMNADFEPVEIYEATRTDIERELTKPGSKARNERGALSVSKFKAIASRVWSSEIGT